jgi:hypothetical protein
MQQPFFKSLTGISGTAPGNSKFIEGLFSTKVPNGYDHIIQKVLFRDQFLN